MAGSTRLSGLDASFLSLETENAPMHIGGVSLLDLSDSREGFGLEMLRDLLASKVGTSRTFTQKLDPKPFDLGRPSWVDEEDLDFEVHVERTRLPEPGGWHELSELAAFELAQHLPRDRPLWHLLLVEGVDSVPGLPPGSAALISRAHHAAIDGVSGAEILGTLFDVEPRLPPPRPERAQNRGRSRERPKSDETREDLRSLGRSLGSAALGSVRGAASAALARGLRRSPPPMPFSAPRSRFNAPVTARRSWGGLVLELGRLQAIRRAAREEYPATLNDVVLAICAGALRRYLGRAEELPGRPLVAMVPVSVREKDQRGTMGNQVSALLVRLATDEDDPRKRLAAIHRETSGSKRLHQALGARTLTDLTRFIPFSLAGLGARLYTKMELAGRHRPPFNLVITNVPGPQIPLYVGPARLAAHLGSAPVFDGLGLILPIFSYAGTLAIGIHGCRRLLPDPEALAQDLRHSLEELEEAFPDSEQE